jgi:uncharacterized protein with PIN domain
VILQRTTYLETSALLAWLFNEPVQADVVRQSVAEASRVITSALTLVECQRAVHRAVYQGRLTPVESLALQHYLSQLASSWIVFSLDDDVLERASGAFAGPPIRTLDAMHVATALEAARQFGSIELLSLDRRVREIAHLAGLPVTPASI